VIEAVITSAGDLRDQHWLDAQIEAIETGVEAVVSIARNWTDGRNLSRLHPGVSAAEYVTARVGTLGKAVVPVLLAESNWSNRQIAAVAGVSRMTVNRMADEGSGGTDVPRPVLGADGKTYPPRVVQAVVIDHATAPLEPPVSILAGDAMTLARLVDELDELRRVRPPEMAAAIAASRRRSVAAHIHRVRAYLGSVLVELEGAE
jgi:hypothetical protein